MTGNVINGDFDDKREAQIYTPYNQESWRGMYVVIRTGSNPSQFTAAVRTEERNLLNAALTMDPGQFTTVAKNFEHRVDAAGALAEANRAYQRRFHSAWGVSQIRRFAGKEDRVVNGHGQYLLCLT